MPKGSRASRWDCCPQLQGWQGRRRWGQVHGSHHRSAPCQPGLTSPTRWGQLTKKCPGPTFLARTKSCPKLSAGMVAHSSRYNLFVSTACERDRAGDVEVLPSWWPAAHCHPGPETSDRSTPPLSSYSFSFFFSFSNSFSSSFSFSLSPLSPTLLTYSPSSPPHHLTPHTIWHCRQFDTIKDDKLLARRSLCPNQPTN